LSVSPPYVFTENHSICSGDTYHWQGNDYTNANTYTANYTSINGCDSIYTLNLVVSPVYAFTESHSICDGDTYHWQGSDYTIANTYTANYTSINGCDSIYTLHLTVNPIYAFTENHSICNGDTYHWQGNDYTSANTYTANYTSINGCDSIYTLNLSVSPVYAFTENHSICNGDTYHWQGNDYTSANTYTANYTSINGCDSIYTLNLAVNPVYAFTENHSMCNGETYNWQGTDYSTANTYTANYTSINSCDSMYTLNLSVNTVDTSLTVSDPTITANASGAIYQWLDCDNAFAIIPGATSQVFNAIANGNYAVIVTQGLCSDTSSCAQILTIGIMTTSNVEGITVYPNPVSDELIIESKGNQKEFYFEIFNSIGQVVFKENVVEKAIVKTSNFDPGVYYIRALFNDSSVIRKVIKL
jgi:Fe-S-cluster-containing hydrogenase component 2